jgi:hypothetical protein
MLTRFKLFCVWDIIPKCVFSNYFWWFEILKHTKLFLISFFMFMKGFVFLTHGFVCIPFHVLAWIHVICK